MLQCGTSIYVLTTTYLAGLLPAALGDWSNIVGALCYIPMVRACPCPYTKSCYTSGTP